MADLQKLESVLYKFKSSAEPVRDWLKRLPKDERKAMAKSNPRTGSRFYDFLKEEGIYDEVQARALKRALVEQIGEGMQAASLTKTDMASKMSTSRSQLDRVLDPDNLSIQLDTLIKATRAVGKVVEIKISKAQRVVSA
jgi:hypothetical protein